MTLSDSACAFYLSLALAAVDELKRQESGDTQRSRVRAKKLRRLEGELVKITDEYLPPEGFSVQDCEKAGNLVDELNERIRQVYPVEETE